MISLFVTLMDSDSQCFIRWLFGYFVSFKLIVIILLINSFIGLVLSRSVRNCHRRLLVSLCAVLSVVNGSLVNWNRVLVLLDRSF